MKQTRKLLGLFLIAGSLISATPGFGIDGAADANAPRNHTAFADELAEARRAYFADVEGEKGAGDRARQQFTALAAKRPNDPVVDAYLGSIDLLESARTFAVWRKHALAQGGLDKLDAAVNRAPENLEARLVRALTTWNLPFFFHRKEQAQQDLSYIGPRAEQAAHQGALPPQLAAAALDYWGQVLAEQSAAKPARQAFEAAVRVDPDCPGGADARKRLGR